MNRIVTVALIAGGLLLLDAPEAAAHKEVRSAHQSPAHYRSETQRARKMPFWLKRNRSFRAWYTHSRLRRNRSLGWHQLVKIYRWERFYRMQHRRGDRHVHYTDFYRDDARIEKRKKRRRQS